MVIPDYLKQVMFKYPTASVVYDTTNNIAGSLFFSEEANMFVLTDHIIDMPVEDRNKMVVEHCNKYNKKFNVDDFKLMC